ncbi:MAG: IS66 family transposase [Planctomycetaceae bacterium]|nr:MAG: IS66 family transposase [Planctomycetaceae bacterium]
MTTDGAPVIEVPPPSPGDLLRELTLQRTINQQLTEQLDSATRRISTMEHQLQQLLHRLYGRSSERIDPAQMALFAEMLKQLDTRDTPPEPPSAPAAPPANRNGHGRRKLPGASNLPRERVIHDLSEDEKHCPGCGTMRTLIGEETSEQLDYVPAQIKVIEHVRLKYACKECEQNAADPRNTGPQITVAEKPLAPIDKGLAAPGLLAHVIVSKYADHLPLHRLERIFQRYDIDIARSTMCDWCAQSAAALRPLYDLMVRRVLDSKVIHTDDTPVDVQDPKLGKTREGRFWVYLGDPRNPLIVFDYTPNRKRDGPMTFLKDWGQEDIRYLQADAFSGYDGIYAHSGGGGRVVEVACWAHARRKFHEARKADYRHSAQALAYIRLLYDVETEAQEAFDAQQEATPLVRSLADIRMDLRQARSAPRLAEFKTWLEGLRAVNGGAILPKSPMGEAITYTLNQWTALCVYLLDGDLAIDNNAAENALRRIAIGRKNWLFAGSDHGGRTAAILFSLIASCQRHDVEPFAYLRNVLTRIASHPHNRLAELLPNNCQPQA